MVSLQRIILSILLIHVKDVHIHASSTPTRRQIVGTQGVWVNVSPRVIPHVLHPVWADVLIMMHGTERVKAVPQVAQSTALECVKEHVKDYVRKHVSISAKNCVLILVNGHARRHVVQDVIQDVPTVVPVVTEPVNHIAQEIPTCMAVQDAAPKVDAHQYVNSTATAIVSIRDANQCAA